MTGENDVNAQRVGFSPIASAFLPIKSGGPQHESSKTPGSLKHAKRPDEKRPIFVVFSLCLKGTQKGVNVLTKLDDPVRNKRISRRFIDTLYTMNSQLSPSLLR